MARQVILKINVAQPPTAESTVLRSLKRCSDKRYGCYAKGVGCSYCQSSTAECIRTLMKDAASVIEQQQSNIKRIHSELDICKKELHKYESAVYTK